MTPAYFKTTDEAVLAVLSLWSMTRAALGAYLNASDTDIGKALQRLKKKGLVRADGSVWVRTYDSRAQTKSGYRP